jgi:nitrite reductase/ring-hydroxylating ferredoxin subunit
MSRHFVAPREDIPEGGDVVIHVNGREVGVHNVDGEYVAYTNWCPHQGAPVCEGHRVATTTATFSRETLEYEEEWTREGEILQCPWHNWTFDLKSGRNLSNSDVKLIEHPVEVEDGNVYVSV